jgi:hypothetical protein
VQGLEPCPVLYLPKGQLRQVGGLPDEPGLHKHEDEDVCACSRCPVPALQTLHAAEPIIDLNVPKKQSVHVPPLGPVYPILQRQLLSTVDPATDCEFVGQLAHVEATVAPVAAEYVPAPHATQELSAAAPVVVRYLPAPQLVHVLARVAPVAVEYVPAGHAAHVDDDDDDDDSALLQEYMIFLQNWGEPSVQPDRHPPMPPVIIHDNRFSPSILQFS